MAGVGQNAEAAMKSYDSFITHYFRRDRSGEELFYPWRSFSQGYVVPTAEKSAQIRRALQRHFRTWTWVFADHYIQLEAAL